MLPVLAFIACGGPVKAGSDGSDDTGAQDTAEDGGPWDIEYVADATWEPDSGWRVEELGNMVSVGGDADGDGLDDVLVGSLYGGDANYAAWLVAGTGEGFASGGIMAVAQAVFALDSQEVPWTAGYCDGLTFAGDLDSDGFEDVAIGLPGTFADDDMVDPGGALSLFHGPFSGRIDSADTLWTGDGEDDVYFGICVVAAGDLDGDGAPDLLVSGSVPPYSLHLVSGASVDGGTTDELETGFAGAESPSHGSAAGDTNGDGSADILVGTDDWWYSDSPATAYLFQGPVTGTRNTATADASLSCTAADGVAGPFTFDAAGDVDGDGYDDVLLGNVACPDPEGAAWFVRGPIEGESELEDVAWAAMVGAPVGFDTTYASQGPSVAVAAAGDLDGDGAADFAVGAERVVASGSEDDPVGSGVYVVFGPVEGTIELAESALVLYDDEDASLGYAISGGGDVDGDGRTDLVLGSPNRDWSPSDNRSGAAYLVLGNWF